MYKFMKRNKTIKIRGESIKAIVLADPKYDEPDPYAENVVKQMGVDARTLVLILAPILLRCRIAINILNSRVKFV